MAAMGLAASDSFSANLTFSQIRRRTLLKWGYCSNLTAPLIAPRSGPKRLSFENRSVAERGWMHEKGLRPFVRFYNSSTNRIERFNQLPSEDKTRIVFGFIRWLKSKRPFSFAAGINGNHGIVRINGNHGIACYLATLRFSKFLYSL